MERIREMKIWIGEVRRGKRDRGEGRGEEEGGADEPYSVSSVYDGYFSDVVLTSIWI